MVNPGKYNPNILALLDKLQNQKESETIKTGKIDSLLKEALFHGILEEILCNIISFLDVKSQYLLASIIFSYEPNHLHHVPILGFDENKAIKPLGLWDLLHKEESGIERIYEIYCELNNKRKMYDGQDYLGGGTGGKCIKICK